MVCYFHGLGNTLFGQLNHGYPVNCCLVIATLKIWNSCAHGSVYCARGSVYRRILVLLFVHTVTQTL